jgi:hypothetical protein
MLKERVQTDEIYTTTSSSLSHPATSSSASLRAFKSVSFIILSVPSQKPSIFVS